MPVRYTWSSVSDMVEMDRSKASHLSSTMAGLLCVCVCLTRRLVGWVAMMEKAGCDKEPSAGVRVGSGSRQLCAHSGPTRSKGDV
jgi:hypothetical protein